MAISNATPAVLDGDMIVMDPNSVVKFTATEDCYLFIDSEYIEISRGTQWFNFLKSTSIRVVEGGVIYLRSLSDNDTIRINIIDFTYTPPATVVVGGTGVDPKNYDFTSLEGETEFTITDIVYTYVQVLANGIKVMDDIYDLTSNGTDTKITFHDSRGLNEWIQIIGFK